jgi:signal transduction histidine kinase
VSRNRFGVRIRTPVVDNDGLHSATNDLNGTAFLNSGMQPIHVEWFNCLYEAVLKLEYAGPGVSRQRVPDSVLWRNSAVSTPQENFLPGLDFAAYNDSWTALPDFANLEPVAKGVATNFSTAYSARAEFTGLVFDGFIKIRDAGNYTFYLTSDDGSRLEVGPSAVSCSIVKGSTGAVPVSKTLEQAEAGRDYHSWVELEGDVVFVAENQHSMELELIERGRRVPVTVVEGAGLFSTNLLNRHIRAQAICDLARNKSERELVGLFIPSAEEVKIYPPADLSIEASSANNVLTNCAQIRRLRPEEANQGIPARIKGVVIATDPLLSMVLEDSSGGVFVHLNWSLKSPNSTAVDTIHTNASTGFYVHLVPPGLVFEPLPPDGSTPLAVGQMWEIEGRTDPGDFSPVVFANKVKFLGQVAMPEPIQPTWEQLMNGSLDAEYVELRGVVASVSTNEMTLLLPNGKVIIEGGSGPLGTERPLPGYPRLAPESLVGSLVRIRGCFTADWDFQTRHVVPGRFYLFPAVTEVEEPARSNPFSIPLSRASDLLSFNARASALQRIKVAGQIIHVRDGEYFLLDGQTGIRVRASQMPTLRPGDLVEAVGFLQSGGPSAVLQEAQTRILGRAPLPEPVELVETNLLARGHDSTLVQAEGTLLNNTLVEDGRILELQNGIYRFAVVFKAHQSRMILNYPIGTRLQLTGVYVSENPALAGATSYPFEILLNDTREVKVLQRPAWWTVTRALVVAAVLAGSLAIAFIWIHLLQRKVEQRTTQLQKEIETRQVAEQHRLMEQERIRVARDLHDELGAGLTEVGILGALAKNPAVQPGERQEYLSQLTESADTLVTSLDEIVWAINPQYDSIESLAGYYSLFAQRFLNLAGIACRLRVAESITQHPLNSKLRHGIFLAFKEALNNVVRHSGATEVEIKIEHVNDQLAISIRDNGKGLAANPALGKDGLSGMSERLRQLGGECRIESNSGRGTLVEFRLNLNGSTA